MQFASGVARDVGIQPFKYITSMAGTIALWLAHMNSSFRWLSPPTHPASAAPAPGLPAKAR